MRIEEVEVKNVPSSAPLRLPITSAGTSSPASGGGLTRDTRDSYLYPSRGNVFDIGYEQVTGDYNYGIGTTRFTQFMTTYQRDDGSGKHVLALRTQLSLAELADASLRPLLRRRFPHHPRLHVSRRRPAVRRSPHRRHALVPQHHRVPDPHFAERQAVLRHVPRSRHGGAEHRHQELPGDGGVRLPDRGADARADADRADFAFPLNRMEGDNQQMFSFYMGMFGGGY